jgi:hypothetical protein
LLRRINVAVGSKPEVVLVERHVRSPFKIRHRQANPDMSVSCQQVTLKDEKDPLTKAASIEALTELLDDLAQVVRVLLDDPQDFL